MSERKPPDDSEPDAQSESFSARLRSKHGDGADPAISLEQPDPATRGEPPSELLERIAAHSLKSSRYKLEGELARGGMGAILRVWDMDLRRRLAMKVILGKSDTSTSGGTPHVDSRTLSRFLEEAQVTGQLDHPGIVPVHELGLDSDGRVYFTMKLVKGRDLKAIYDLVFEGKEGWNETRALSVLLRACEAMAYAHQKGVIHRDLKPANIMVGNYGEVYVMDWGLARVLGRKDTHDIRIAAEFSSSLHSVQTERRGEREHLADSPIVTMDGDVVGTPSYMPPEQARGEVAKVSARSDVYALGAILYHLLARHPPYVTHGMRASNRTLLAMVLHGAPPALSSQRGDAPPELVAICEKAMQRDPSQRYVDTMAMANDLRAFLEHRVVAAYEQGPYAHAKKWVVRNKLVSAALALCGALLVSGPLIWSHYRQLKLEQLRSEEAAVLSASGPIATEVIGPIVRRLSARILNGDSSAQDRSLFASTCMRASPSCASLQAGGAAHAGMSVIPLWPTDDERGLGGLGLLLSPHFLLDGVPVPSDPTDDQVLLNGYFFLDDAVRFLTTMNSPTFGHHIFGGALAVQLVDARPEYARSSARGSPITSPYKQIGEPIYLQLQACTFTYLDAVPTTYPVALLDGRLIDEFRKGIQVSASMSVRASNPMRLLICLQIVFQPPQLTFPLDVTLFHRGTQVEARCGQSRFSSDPNQDCFMVDPEETRPGELGDLAELPIRLLIAPDYYVHTHGETVDVNDPRTSFRSRFARYAIEQILLITPHETGASSLEQFADELVLVLKSNRNLLKHVPDISLYGEVTWEIPIPIR